MMLTAADSEITSKRGPLAPTEKRVVGSGAAAAEAPSGLAVVLTKTQFKVYNRARDAICVELNKSDAVNAYNKVKAEIKDTAVLSKLEGFLEHHFADMDKNEDGLKVLDAAKKGDLSKLADAKSDAPHVQHLIEITRQGAVAHIKASLAGMIPQVEPILSALVSAAAKKFPEANIAMLYNKSLSDLLAEPSEKEKINFRSLSDLLRFGLNTPEFDTALLKAMTSGFSDKDIEVLKGLLLRSPALLEAFLATLSLDGDEEAPKFDLYSRLHDAEKELAEKLMQMKNKGHIESSETNIGEFVNSLVAEAKNGLKAYIQQSIISAHFERELAALSRRAETVKDVETARSLDADLHEFTRQIDEESYTKFENQIDQIDQIRKTCATFLRSEHDTGNRGESPDFRRGLPVEPVTKGAGRGPIITSGTQRNPTGAPAAAAGTTATGNVAYLRSRFEPTALKPATDENADEVVRPLDDMPPPSADTVSKNDAVKNFVDALNNAGDAMSMSKIFVDKVSLLNGLSEELLLEGVKDIDKTHLNHVLGQISQDYKANTKQEIFDKIDELQLSNAVKDAVKALFTFA